MLTYFIKSSKGIFAVRCFTNSKGEYECWLCHEDYGIMSLIFGVSAYKYSSIEDFGTFVESYIHSDHFDHVCRCFYEKHCAS